MDRMLVVVFDNEDKAIEGSQVLRELDKERKAKLEARIDALNARLKQKTDQAKARREAIRLQAHIRAKHEQRVARADKEYQEWMERVEEERLKADVY